MIVSEYLSLQILLYFNCAICDYFIFLFAVLSGSFGIVITILNVYRFAHSKRVNPYRFYDFMIGFIFIVIFLLIVKYANVFKIIVE